MNEHEKIESDAKHARAYAWRFFKRFLTNLYSSGIKQSVFSSLLISAVTVAVLIYTGLIEFSKRTDNVLATSLTIAVVLGVFLVISLIRVPFQLDREHVIKFQSKANLPSNKTLQDKRKPVTLRSRTAEQNSVRAPSYTSSRSQQRPDSGPNVGCMRTYLQQVLYTNSSPLSDEYIFFEERGGDGMGILAEFCNEPIRDKVVSSLDEINAQVFYYGLSDRQLKHKVQKGVWLGETGSVWLHAGDSQKLLLGLLDPTKESQFTTVDNSPTSESHYFYPVPILSGLHIRVRLLDRTQWARVFGFDIKFSDEQLQIIYKGVFDSINI